MYFCFGSRTAIGHERKFDAEIAPPPTDGGGRKPEPELDRLSKLPPAAAEYGVIKTYLDWLSTLPWNKSTENEINIQKTREILEDLIVAHAVGRALELPRRAAPAPARSATCASVSRARRANTAWLMPSPRRLKNSSNKSSNVSRSAAGSSEIVRKRAISSVAKPAGL